MRHSWANTVLLVLLILQLVTGVGGLIAGSERFSWVLWFHGAGGYAVAVLLLWKGMVIFDVFSRPWRRSWSRIAFIGLTLLLLAVLITGWLWTYAGRIYAWGMSVIVWPGCWRWPAACGRTLAA